MSGMKGAAKLLHNTPLGAFDELDQFPYVSRLVQLFHLHQGLLRIQI
jgi:hypothetical protein